MKRILLASASLFAFAGVAYADGHSSVSFGGDAELGFNEEVKSGFFYNADLVVTMSATLDNGLTASATGDLNFAQDTTESTRGTDVVNTSYVLSLSSEMATLSFGDVDPVGDAVWSGVDGSGVAGFNDGDTHFDVAGFDAILRGDVMYAGVNGYVSFGVDTSGAGNDLTGEDIAAMQLAADGTFGAFGFIFAYQEEFGPTPEIIAVAATASVIGADVKLAFETDGTETSIGIGASYPVGPVTLGGYFTSNDIADDSFGISADYASGPISVSAAYDSDKGTDSVEVDATYDVGNGITALAGVGSDLTNETVYYYVAGEVDLGGGASFLLSFADDESAAANDEIGGPEFNQGITAKLAFSF
jgi:outer membrane protein OmpU